MAATADQLQGLLNDLADALAALSNRIGDLTVELRREILDIEHIVDDLNHENDR